MVGIVPRRSGPDRGLAALRADSARSFAAASTLARARDHLLADRRQPHVAPVALDELHAEHGLELLDAGRERGLGDELRLGRCAEVQALGELDEVAQLPQRGQRQIRCPPPCVRRDRTLARVYAWMFLRLSKKLFSQC